MGHMNFENLVKISRKEGVKEIPEISRPTNTLESLAYGVWLSLILIHC